MSLNLLEQAKSYFNNEVINQASGSLNESESSLSKAIQVIIPTIIGFISDKASTAEGSSNVIKLAAEQESKGILSTISDFLHHEGGASLREQGETLTKSLFGQQETATVQQIANYSGTKPSSVSTLIGMALPTILGLIGKHFKGSDFNIGQIADFFKDQKTSAASLLPSGFSIAGLTGSAPAETSKPPVVAHEHHEEHTADHSNKKESSKSIWVLPLLAFLLALLAVWWFTRDKSEVKHDQAHGDTTEMHSEATANESMVSGTLDPSGEFIYNEGDSTTITLPNNAGDLHVGKYSTEARLVAFLNDNTAEIDTAKGNWFEFTNVHFKLNSTELTDASNNQLKNMVAITKAYPSAKFKFGGYTDNTGSAETNIALSQKRADAIAALVVKLGANKDSFEPAKGYGPEFPLADNSTAEGRAQNRRVAINVKAK